jgi:hypothetical protein
MLERGGRTGKMGRLGETSEDLGDGGDVGLREGSESEGKVSVGIGSWQALRLDAFYSLPTTRYFLYASGGTGAV